MADQKSSLPPPVKSQRVIHVPQSKDTSQSIVGKLCCYYIIYSHKKSNSIKGCVYFKSLCYNKKVYTLASHAML